MSTVPDFRTNVWRQACRSIQIEESFAHITEILAHYIPFQQAILFAIDQKKSVMEALAYGFPAPPGARESHIHLSDTQLLALLGGPAPTSLFHTGGNDPRSELIAQFFPHYHKQDCIAGLLNYQERYRGLVLFIANPSTRFSSSHRTQIADLLEPLSVALGNDHILRELNVLREAAERDKEALLHRLGRTELGDTIIGSTTTLRAVMERVDLVARSDLPILILGETGTGKELIAREIHRRSLRASGPIMRVNCGAIPPQLIDSQLFGHQRGAFTGATDTHKGWFERADGGTLFLDEIGELSLSVQVRLLRILQDGWLERVGSSKPIKVDVRVIAATHRDLATMVKQGEFREDLWYRIAVFPLQLPPLRERLEDIPQLVKYFAERSAVRFNLPFQLP
ncbi:MAG: sigma 54-interacting transcriptional regulator, partial [bacterium]|nr:sigma 54-interacting transcriptional regulator [bacterium]